MHKLKKFAGRLIVAIQYRLELLKGYYNSSVVSNPAGNAYISGRVTLDFPQHITIGSNSYVNGGQLCASENASITIGKDCLISYHVHMRTDMHLYKKRGTLIRKQGHKEADIVIGNDVWIGYGVQIFGGVTIGDGCVIGAGTIVTKDVKPYQVVVGAGGGMRVIGERSQCLETKGAVRQDQ